MAIVVNIVEMWVLNVARVQSIPVGHVEVDGFQNMDCITSRASIIAGNDKLAFSKSRRCIEDLVSRHDGRDCLARTALHKVCNNEIRRRVKVEKVIFED